MADQENTNQNENVPNEEEINTDPVQNEEEKVEPEQNEEKTEETTHQEENVVMPESNYSPGTNMAQYENVNCFI